MDDATRPVTVTLPRAAWILLIAFGLVQVAMLVVQASLQEDQRRTVRTQRAIAERQAQLAFPLLEELRPLATGARDGLPRASRLVDSATKATREAVPLIEQVKDAQLDRNLPAAGALAATLLDADVGSATRATRVLAENLVAADVPRMTREVSDVVFELQTQRRLRRLLVRSVAVLGEVRERDLIEKAATAAEVTPDLAKATAELLRIQRETLPILKETLAVAREAEKHAESLDTKTGGPAATPPAR